MEPQTVAMILIALNIWSGIVLAAAEVAARPSARRSGDGA
jgi:hypothetical protein